MAEQRRGKVKWFSGSGVIRLSIKGPLKSAKRAASRNRVSVRNCHKLKSGRVVCDVPCRQEVAVARWFGKKGTIRPGRGYPPGTLVFYSSTCSR